MDYFVLKENILLWSSQPAILPTKNITQQIFLFDGLALKHVSEQTVFHTLKQKVFFIM